MLKDAQSEMLVGFDRIRKIKHARPKKHTHTMTYTNTHEYDISEMMTLAWIEQEKSKDLRQAHAYLPYMHYPSPGTREMEISWPLEASPSSALTRWRTCMPKVG